MNNKNKQGNVNLRNKSFIFGFFINYLKPSVYVEGGIGDINLLKLKEQGIKMIICDLDNTLVPHFTKFPNKNAINFVREVQKNEMKFILVSNNTRKRVDFFAKKLDVDFYISNAKKPLTSKTKNMINASGFKREEILMIGDFIITDIFLSNILKINSILVPSLIDGVKGSTSKIMIFLEKKVFSKLSRENLITRDESEKKDEYEIL